MSRSRRSLLTSNSVEAFFDLVPNLSRLLHRARFLARLALPPTHSNFPHPALIHAVCSCAAAWCEPRVYQGSSKYGSSASFGTGSGSEEAMNGKSSAFGLQQAAYGKEAIQDGLNTGNRLFDVVRAMIILSRVFIDDTRYVTFLFMLTGAEYRAGCWSVGHTAAWWLA